MEKYLKGDYWGPHVSLDHDCGRGRPTLACFCFLKSNSKKNPQKENHANFKISCYQNPPQPNPYGCSFSRTDPTNFTNRFNQCPAPWVPCLPVHPCSPATLPSTDGAQILRWKTVRRDCRRKKYGYRAFMVESRKRWYYLVPGPNFLTGRNFFGEFSSSKHRFSGANC